MPPELDSPNSEPKQYSDEEISKILNTAKATRSERDEAARKAKELEENNKKLSEQLEQIKKIDPQRYQDLEKLAQTYEEKKLEEQRNFQELQTRYKDKEASLLQENNQLKESLKQTQVVNALEKAFYSIGGKAGKDDDGYSYFDLIRERAMNYVVLDETSGKLIVVDPKDKTVMKDPKTGSPYTIDDLMLKLRSSGPTAALFEPVGNGYGSGMNRSQSNQNPAMIREQLSKLPPAERLAKARELGL